jgi:hypothetical protein
MKRIKLKQKIHGIIDTKYMMSTDFFEYKQSIIKKLIKLIGNNYRRRQYKHRGYTCNGCGKNLGDGIICNCKLQTGVI